SGKLAWQFKTGGPVVSSPVLVGSTITIGSSDAHVYALNLDDGRMRWSAATGGRVSASSPASDEGLIFIGTENVDGGDGTLFALDAETGQERWRVTLGAPVLSAPTVVGEVVYFGSNDLALHAVDAKTGAERWKFATSGNVTGAAAVTDDV